MRRVATAVAVAAASCLMLVGPAAAETVSISDPAQDVPGLAATDDIRSVTITNNRAGITFTVKVVDLAPGAGVVGLMIEPVHDSTTLKLRVRRYDNGRVTNNWIYQDGQEYWGGQCWELEAAWRPGRNKITVQVPRHCLPDLRTALRVSAFYRHGEGSAWNPADRTTFAKVRYR